MVEASGAFKAITQKPHRRACKCAGHVPRQQQFDLGYTRAVEGNTWHRLRKAKSGCGETDERIVVGSLCLPSWELWVYSERSILLPMGLTSLAFGGRNLGAALGAGGDRDGQSSAFATARLRQSGLACLRRSRQPYRIPIDVVEVFFGGQGATDVQVPGHKIESRNIVVRLAERHKEWHRAPNASRPSAVGKMATFPSTALGANPSPPT